MIGSWLLRPDAIPAHTYIRESLRSTYYSVQPIVLPFKFDMFFHSLLDETVHEFPLLLKLLETRLAIVLAAIYLIALHGILAIQTPVLGQRAL